MSFSEQERSMTTSITKRTYKKKKTRMGFGSNGWATLKLAYQVGGFTAEQHARFFETENVRNSYRILANLSEQRLLEQAPVQTRGRPKDFHFLSKANGSRGVLLGGYEAGVRERAVLPGYKRFQLPATVEHRHALNEHLLGLREAAADDPDVEVPLEGLRGESHPGFPLLGEAATRSNRSNARTVYERIYPDGLFEVGFGEGLTCRYLLEYESRSRPSHVFGKLDSYGAHFSRLLDEDGDSMEGWLRPVVFLFPASSTAAHVANTVSEAARAAAPELRRFIGWTQAAANSGFYAGRLVLFAALEDLGDDPLGVRYRALTAYPEDRPGVSEGRLRVDMEAVAEEVAEVLAAEDGGGVA